MRYRDGKEDSSLGLDEWRTDHNRCREAKAEWLQVIGNLSTAEDFEPYWDTMLELLDYHTTRHTNRNRAVFLKRKQPSAEEEKDVKIAEDLIDIVGGPLKGLQLAD